MGLWIASISCLVLAAHAATVPVAGVVRDADSGAPIAAAIVTVATLQQAVLTDEHGRYVLEAPPGIYHVTVYRFGYAARSFDALIPEEGVLEINVELRREPIMLSPIEVRAPLAARGLDGAADAPDFPDRSMTQAAIYQHPLSAEPDPLRAMSGGEVAMDPESPSGINIRGGASDQVAYLIDGIPVFSPYHTGGTFGAWNPDALASVDVIAATPVHAAPDVLSGVVSARTRTPGDTFHSRGSVSATQVRASVDGPVGRSGAGYLASVGSAFPGLMVHKNEASHLRGDNLDWLGKLEAPLLGGRARLVGYGTRTDVNASSEADADSLANNPARNSLGWGGRSIGVEWTRPVGDAALIVRAWTAQAEANSHWAGPDSLELLASHRRDDGAVAMIETPSFGGNTTLGTRVQRIETGYSLQRFANGGTSLSVADETPVTTAFVQHERPLSASVVADVGIASAFALDELYTSPSAQLRWRASRAVLVSATAARRHQFAQSLRNSESVVSHIFPADLYVGAGDSGIPVATSDIGIVAVEHRLRSWLRVGAQAYLRDFESIALVAPRSADPYAADGFVVGSGESYGFSVEGAASREHLGVLANYAYQSVELRYADGSYAPTYGAAHRIQAGLLFSPVSSYTVRLGLEGAMGRRTTAALGAFEWEASNMLDGGGEFAGSPSEWSGALGGTNLPAYFRLDVGVRKQWNLRMGNREASLGIFGTATNVLARRNVLTVAVDPATGARRNIDMIPPSPLVVGIDWRF